MIRLRLAFTYQSSPLIFLVSTARRPLVLVLGACPALSSNLIRRRFAFARYHCFPRFHLPPTYLSTRQLRPPKRHHLRISHQQQKPDPEFHTTFTMASGPEVSHGRGGAGNINPDDTKYVDGEVVRAGPEGSHGDGAFSTGRGGMLSTTLTLFSPSPSSNP